MGFLTSEFDIMLIIGVATFILLLIEIFVSMHERTQIKDDLECVWDELEIFCGKDNSAKFKQEKEIGHFIKNPEVDEEEFKKMVKEINKTARVEIFPKETPCITFFGAAEYQKLAMRTNDGNCTDRLFDKAEMIEFFKDAKGGKPCEKYDFGGIINASMGLSGEVGELNDFLKKWVFHGHEMDEEKVKKEIGDVCWYVALMCESFGFELSEIMHMNIEKLKARYPEGFDPQKSINRKEGDV